MRHERQIQAVAAVVVQKQDARRAAVELARPLGPVRPAAARDRPDDARRTARNQRDGLADGVDASQAVVPHIFLKNARRQVLDGRQHEHAPAARLALVLARGAAAQARPVRDEAATELP